MRKDCVLSVLFVLGVGGTGTAIAKTPVLTTQCQTFDGDVGLEERTPMDTSFDSDADLAQGLEQTRENGCLPANSTDSGAELLTDQFRFCEALEADRKATGEQANLVEYDLYVSSDRYWTFMCGGMSVTVGPVDVLLSGDDIDTAQSNPLEEADIDSIDLSSVVWASGWYSVTSSGPEFNSSDLLRFALNKDSDIDALGPIECKANRLILASDVGTDVDALGHID